MARRQEQNGAATAAPPYLAYRTFRTFIESLKQQGIPSRIDRSVMPTLSGSNQAAILAALKYLRLITQEAKPEPVLGELVESEGAERQRVLGEVLKKAYSFLFEELDLKRATAEQFLESFRQTGASGDTVRKCASFFLSAAKEAGFELSPYLEKSVRSRGEPKLRRQRVSEAAGSFQQASSLAPPTAKPTTIAEMFLAKFPEFDPGWSEDLKMKWFEGFKWLMENMADINYRTGPK